MAWLNLKYEIAELFAQEHPLGRVTSIGFHETEPDFLRGMGVERRVPYVEHLPKVPRPKIVREKQPHEKAKRTREKKAEPVGLVVGRIKTCACGCGTSFAVTRATWTKCYASRRCSRRAKENRMREALRRVRAERSMT